MSHWFDRFCVTMARRQSAKNLPRRSFLFGLTSAVAAAGVEGPRSALAQVPNQRFRQEGIRQLPHLAQMRDQCVRAWKGDELVQRVQSQEGEFSYQRQLTYNRATKTVVSEITVKQGDKLVAAASAI